MPPINEKIYIVLSLILGLVHTPLLLASDNTSASIVKFQQTMATKGHATAQYQLAMMYENGDGVEQNLETARHWYGRSASQAYTPAAHRLQYLDITRTGTTASPAWIKQLQRDADSGDGETMLLLGQMYAQGTGVPQELTQASHYLRKARAENIPGSDSELTRVESAIKQQRADTQAAAEKQQAAVMAQQAQQRTDAKQAEQQRRQQILQQKKLADSQQLKQQNSLNQARNTQHTQATPPKARKLVDVNSKTTLPATPGAVPEMDLSPCSGRNRFASTCR